MELSVNTHLRSALCLSPSLCLSDSFTAVSVFEHSTHSQTHILRFEYGWLLSIYVTQCYAYTCIISSGVFFSSLFFISFFFWQFKIDGSPVLCICVTHTHTHEHRVVDLLLGGPIRHFQNFVISVQVYSTVYIHNMLIKTFELQLSLKYFHWFLFLQVFWFLVRCLFA